METAKQKALRYLRETQSAVQGIDIDGVFELSKKIKSSLNAGGKVMVFGNGGSAADAQHLAAELVVRFEKNRKPMSALALSANTSTLTAVGNDFGFEKVFSRQVEALAGNRDVVIAISTSGNSPNVLEGVEAAKRKGCFTAGFTGKEGCKLKNAVDLCIGVNSKKTADIQVCHITLIHLLCFLLESTDCE